MGALGLAAPVLEAVRAMADKTVRVLELLGRKVYSADGKDLGRVYDLQAEKEGDELRVCALVVSPSTWRERFGWSEKPRGRYVRWEDIASLDPTITLRRGAHTEG